MSSSGQCNILVVYGTQGHLPPTLLDTALGPCSHVGLEVCICWVLPGQSQLLPVSLRDSTMSKHIQVYLED